MALKRSLSLALALGTGVLCMLVSSLLPGVSALIIAILLGMITTLLGLGRNDLVRGMRSSSKRVLRIGVVLLGFQLTVGALLDLGLGALLLMIVSSGTTFVLTLFLSRFFRVTRSSAYLVATGVSICGASAIAAMSTVVQPKSEHSGDSEGEVAESIAIITLLGTVAMFLVPFIGSTVLGLSDEMVGVWIGLSVHEVAQVVAAGSAVSALALSTATVAKLARVLLLVPVVTGVGLNESRRTVSAAHESTTSRGRRGPIIPLFVVGFICTVAARTLLDIPAPILEILKYSSTLLLTAAMFAIGTTVDVRRLIRTGGPLLALGVVSTLIITTVSLVGVFVLQGM